MTKKELVELLSRYEDKQVVRIGYFDAFNINNVTCLPEGTVIIHHEGE